MAGQVFAYVKYTNGVLDDSALELLVAAKKLTDGPVTGVVIGSGGDLDKVCGEAAKAYNAVWKINNPALAYPNAEIVRKALVNILPAGAIFLLPHDSFGMDLGPGLSIKLNAAFISDIVAIEGMAGDALKVVRQEFSGQVSTHVDCSVAAGAVINVRPGVFQPQDIQAAGEVVDKSGEAGDLSAKRKFLEIVEAEVGDVDITKSEVLVSVGRGIEEQDNLEIVFELAEAMGADVSCSRPIVDAKWLEKSRQVGTSGQTVKPKVYMALGISGSFQHLGGLKGNPFIIAINKNPKAPIFQVADVGVEANIIEFLPELTEKIKEL